jgi:hypothetical protein
MLLSRNPQLVYLDAYGQGTTTCPKCADKGIVSGNGYRDLHTTLTATCACGCRFLVLLNTRQYYRKSVCLTGTYTPRGQSATRRITVNDLSLSGLRFHTLLPHTLKVDDVVELDFSLDDAKHTRLYQWAVISWIAGQQVGAKFCNVKTFEKELGFYLRPS